MRQKEQGRERSCFLLLQEELGQKAAPTPPLSSRQSPPSLSANPPGAGLGLLQAPFSNAIILESCLTVAANSPVGQPRSPHRTGGNTTAQKDGRLAQTDTDRAGATAGLPGTGPSQSAPRVDVMSQSSPYPRTSHRARRTPGAKEIFVARQQPPLCLAGSSPGGTESLEAGETSDL